MTIVVTRDSTATVRTIVFANTGHSLGSGNPNESTGDMDPDTALTVRQARVTHCDNLASVVGDPIPHHAFQAACCPETLPAKPWISDRHPISRSRVSCHVQRLFVRDATRQGAAMADNSWCKLGLHHFVDVPDPNPETY